MDQWLRRGAGLPEEGSAPASEPSGGRATPRRSLAAAHCPAARSAGSLSCRAALAHLERGVMAWARGCSVLAAKLEQCDSGSVSRFVMHPVEYLSTVRVNRRVVELLMC